MRKNFHIITGGSKGLGASIARHLAEGGDQVVSLSRSTGHAGRGICEYAVDLKSFSSAEVFNQILSDFHLEDFNSVTLTNNAGLIEPISPAASLMEKDVKENLAVNLIAPINLTVEFLRRTEVHGGARTVLMISSGVARRPKATWSVYSAAKAGLEAFAAALRKEVAESGVKVATLDPGLMDTDMQATIRASREDDFPERGRFTALKKEGGLRSPEVVARAIAELLTGKTPATEAHIEIDRLLSIQPKTV